MKCWNCDKEETNSDVKINVEQLIWTVQCYFRDEQSYKQVCKEKPYWKRTQEEHDTVQYYEKNRDSSDRAVNILVSVLGLDCNKLYVIARLARKWEQKSNWENCFPAQDNAKKIIDWLTSQDKSFESEIGYINYKINKKAVKTAA